jgi:hypothetical protein
VVTICTASLTLNNSTFCPHSVFMCFVWISEQTVIISLYRINWLVFITETECVYCSVRTECLYTIAANPKDERAKPVNITVTVFFPQNKSASHFSLHFLFLLLLPTSLSASPVGLHMVQTRLCHVIVHVYIYVYVWRVAWSIKGRLKSGIWNEVKWSVTTDSLHTADFFHTSWR